MDSTCSVCLRLHSASRLSSDTNLYRFLFSVSNDDQVKAYIKKIISQLNKWMVHGKISKLVIVITSKDTGEHVERWQFDVQIFNQPGKSRTTAKPGVDKENSAPR
jgi:mitotic spindle assembly checkpoint protein MAD2